jgi:hypothetical protein
LLDWIRPPDPAQYTREFPFGKRTLGATRAHTVLSEWFYVEDWGREIEYTVRWGGRPVIVTVSPADIFAQLLLHEAHHRAQAMAMLRLLGVAAEDLDYNVLMYRRRDA